MTCRDPSSPWDLIFTKSLIKANCILEGLSEKCRGSVPIDALCMVLSLSLTVLFGSYGQYLGYLLLYSVELLLLNFALPLCCWLNLSGVIQNSPINFYFTYCKNVIADIENTWEKFLSHFSTRNQE